MQVELRPGPETHKVRTPAFYVPEDRRRQENVTSRLPHAPDGVRYSCGVNEGVLMDRERRKRRQALVAWVAIGALVGVPLLSVVFSGL